MTGYLLDTDVLSMLAPSKQTPVPPAFRTWLTEKDQRGALWLSAVTVHEVEKGVVLLERRGLSARSNSLRTWLD